VSDETVISWFSELGRTDYKEVYSQEVKDFSKLEMSEKELLSKYSFANDLTADQLKIVEMINNGESYGSIVKAIDKGATYVSRQLVELEKLGMIKGFELTPKGKTNVGEVSFEVVYQYREREGIPPLKGESRPFCKNLINIKRVFTREEIDQITARLKANGIDRNVWEYKGGWYTNPETGVHTPSCRHTWFQIIVNK
jgi:predicted transcriptional regulator